MVSVEALPTPAAQRFRSLDALRGICALMVAALHFGARGYVSGSKLVEHSYLFVDYFFVLSGFVIAFSYGDRIADKRISVGRFMGLRMGRIYPLHLAMMAAYFIVELILSAKGSAFASVTSRHAFSGPRSISALADNVLLLQSFGTTPFLTWNSPSWSIAAEMWCYLLTALVCFAFPRSRLAIFAGLSLAALIGLALSSESLNLTYELGFVRCLYGFSIGMLAFAHFRRLSTFGGTAAELACVGLIIAFVTFAEGAWTFAAPIVFAIAIMCFARKRGAVSTILARPTFQLLGLVSYSIYMIHAFFEARFLQVLELVAPAMAVTTPEVFILVRSSGMLGDLLTIAMLTALVGCAYVSYRLVEKPGNMWARRRLSPVNREPSARISNKGLA